MKSRIAELEAEVKRLKREVGNYKGSYEVMSEGYARLKKEAQVPVVLPSSKFKMDWEHNPDFIEGWNAHRAAMLKLIEEVP